MNILKRKWLQLRRKIRWALGKGWDTTDFSGRYESPEKDSWSYTSAPAHAERLQRILKALSPLSGKRVLELGCAEGFITQEIGKQSASVVACELSPLAAERTRNVCLGLPVTVIAGDIRTCLPDGSFDLILASDVFYYLTASELSQVASTLANNASEDGRLIMANEWNSAYAQLTSPDQIIHTIMDTTRWRMVEKDVAQNPSGTHTIATFRLLKS